MRRKYNKDQGKDSEKKFEEIMLALYGKYVYVYRLVDTRELKGNIPSAFVRKQPADYVVTDPVEGMHYAEVKSSSDGRASFSFNHITQGQKIALKMQQVAKGKYFLYIHNVTTNTWYKVPGSLIDKIEKEGRKSVKWSELTGCKWIPANELEN